MVDEFTSCEKLKIACILDEFSYECFKYEAVFLQIEPCNWQLTLNGFQPDLLFVESVWEGKNRSWRHRFRSMIDGTLGEIVNWCRKRDVPTVFWNKEDPPNFQLFLNNARLFDYVFTTDEDCIPKYKRKLPHERIHVLPFAAQPKIHNPVNRLKEKMGEIAFAGTWYNTKYPERRNHQAIMLKSAMLYDLTIYDRMSASSEKQHYEYPSLFTPYIKEALPYAQLIKAYKQYDVFLNVDSVNSSPTMFSRRVYELLACGTPVVSSYSRGVERLFSHIVSLCKSEEDWAKSLKDLLENFEYREKISLQGQREVFRHHTYAHRLQNILNLLGFRINNTGPCVAIIAVLKDPNRINALLDNYRRQRYQPKKLILIVMNKFENQIRQAIAMDNKNDIQIHSINSFFTEDGMLRYGLSQAKSPYVSVLSEYDYYGPEFISDLMHAIQYTGAAVVGKASYFTFQGGSEPLSLQHLGEEYEYSSAINPSTILIDKKQCHKLLHTGLSHQFLEAIKHSHLKTYSSDYYQYLYNYYANHQAEKNPEQESWGTALLV